MSELFTYGVENNWKGNQIVWMLFQAFQIRPPFHTQLVWLRLTLEDSLD